MKAAFFFALVGLALAVPNSVSEVAANDLAARANEFQCSGAACLSCGPYGDCGLIQQCGYSCDGHSGSKSYQYTIPKNSKRVLVYSCSGSNANVYPKAC